MRHRYIYSTQLFYYPTVSNTPFLCIDLIELKLSLQDEMCKEVRRFFLIRSKLSIILSSKYLLSRIKMIVIESTIPFIHASLL